MTKYQFKRWVLNHTYPIRHPKKNYKQYQFVKKYPFYAFSNKATNKTMRPKYEHTWYDCIPTGWQKAFGQQFSDDLLAVLEKTGYLNSFRFFDIKEKWGSLDIIANIYVEEIDKVLEAYSIISEHACICCGELDVGSYKGGWILPICKTCYDEDSHGYNKPYEEMVCEKRYWKIPNYYEVSDLKGNKRKIDISKYVQKVREGAK